MDRPEIERRVKSIFHVLFNCDPETVTADSSPDNVPGWDSLQHLNLVLALEEEFQTSFDERQVVDMLSVALIVEIVTEATA
ncbi:MAG TPA: acyl carrier protein [Gemmatimonadaceae bacterium]|jgi:acyl carrier protein